VTRAVPAQPANSAENPFPVRAVAIRIAGWIDKLGTVWVEGQLAQINIRPGAKTVFMVLREGSLIFEGPQDELEASEEPYVSKFVKRRE